MANLRHAITKAYLNKIAKQFTLEDIASARKKFDAASGNRLKPKVKSVKDVLTNENGIRLRVYNNNPTNVMLPVIVYFHGGGFVLGSLSSHDSICRNLSRYSNCVVVSVEYSLAPEAPYPAPINEGLEVLDWLGRFGSKLGIDVSNVFLAGDSAGGNIALHVATNSKMPSSLKGLVLIYPTLDPTLSTQSMQQYATGHFLTKAMLVELWSLYEGGEKAYKLPPNVALKRLPPVLIVAAEKDVLKDEGSDFAKKLRSFNKAVEYECYGNMLHGFMQFPRIASKKSQAFRRIAVFVNTHSAKP